MSEQLLDEVRPAAFGVAYRMLGSVAEAEDVVQEALLRLHREVEGGAQIASPRAFVSTVAARLALDQLRSARVRRERYVGDWLPEPVPWGSPIAATTSVDPLDSVTLDESISTALLVVLESLTPPERLAFVLHDVFGVPFDEIAPVVERSPAATRQLASRARRRVRAEAPEPDADLAVQWRVVDAFLAAAREGDFDGLLRVLDPDVVLRVDGGPDAPKPFARPPIVGAEAVASQAQNFRGAGENAEPVIVNGAPGFLVRFPARSFVGAFTVANGRIVAIDLIADPNKLRGLPAD
jgi:RNA polymerase sigma factor (sigma-70 family)